MDDKSWIFLIFSLFSLPLLKYYMRIAKQLDNVGNEKGIFKLDKTND